jgi:hypothetical protein
VGVPVSLARQAHRNRLWLSTRPRRAAFQQGLQQLGWTDGRNVRIIARWGAGDADSGASFQGTHAKVPESDSDHHHF